MRARNATAAERILSVVNQALAEQEGGNYEGPVTLQERSFEDDPFYEPASRVNRPSSAAPAAQRYSNIATQNYQRRSDGSWMYYGSRPSTNNRAQGINLPAPPHPPMFNEGPSRQTREGLTNDYALPMSLADDSALPFERPAVPRLSYGATQLSQGYQAGYSQSPHLRAPEMHNTISSSQHRRHLDPTVHRTGRSTESRSNHPLQSQQHEGVQHQELQRREPQSLAPAAEGPSHQPQAGPTPAGRQELGRDLVHAAPWPFLYEASDPVELERKSRERRQQREQRQREYAKQKEQKKKDKAEALAKQQQQQQQAHDAASASASSSLRRASSLRALNTVTSFTGSLRRAFQALRRPPRAATPSSQTSQRDEPREKNDQEQDAQKGPRGNFF
ncbi:hypothetical protein GGS23DRAFT_513009 [Durotheca rogersii]|uniref:uncharacterized protein n=1 Tax=Durotheca rogersii TaxID=419775 RepID=UPI00221E5EA7|nr:uncharacterized protein GGS23DRAFT_513009 [Durotheca rogersii]KAI5863759.1 hypothetical protein GGS23DRAFT_513009 [Durotheca rogersii]